MFKKAKKEDQKPESRNERQISDEDAFGKLHVDYGLRQAFMENEPMSRERYDGLYFHGNGPGAYFNAPSYEEYLKLFDKYKGRSSYSDYYIENMM